MTKAVDIAVSLPVHVVVYTVPSLRRPPVLLVLTQAIRGGEITGVPKGGEQQKDPPLLDFSMVGRATNVLVFGRS